MSMVVPELKLYELINVLMSEVGADYNRHSNKENTMLFHLFGNSNKIGKYDYYEQAVDLFTRKADHPNKINIRMMYDAAQASIPTIHITMPSENDDHNTIGVGEGGKKDDIIYDDVEKTSTPLYNRRFQTQFHIVCTSTSSQEVFLMYHVLRAAMVASLDYIDLMGLKNPKLSGQDIRQKDDQAPNHIYMRGIGLACFYIVEIPRYFDTKLIANVIIGSGTPITGTSQTTN